MTRSSHKDFISIILVAPYDITRHELRIHLDAHQLFLCNSRSCKTDTKRIGEGQRLKRACPSVQSHQSFRSYWMLQTKGHISASSWQNQQTDPCAKRRLRSAWTSAQSVQSLRCPYEEILGLPLPNERTAKTYQTGRMSRLIWVFAARTDNFVGFVMLRLISDPSACARVFQLSLTTQHGQPWLRTYGNNQQYQWLQRVPLDSEFPVAGQNRNIRIFKGCEMQIENSVTNVTVRHHEWWNFQLAPNKYYGFLLTYGFFFSCTHFIRQLHLRKRSALAVN